MRYSFIHPTLRVEVSEKRFKTRHASFFFSHSVENDQESISFIHSFIHSSDPERQRSNLGKPISADYWLEAGNLLPSQGPRVGLSLERPLQVPLMPLNQRTNSLWLVIRIPWILQKTLSRVPAARQVIFVFSSFVHLLSAASSTQATPRIWWTASKHFLSILS